MRQLNRQLPVAVLGLGHEMVLAVGKAQNESFQRPQRAEQIKRHRCGSCTVSANRANCRKGIADAMAAASAAGISFSSPDVAREQSSEREACKLGRHSPSKSKRRGFISTSSLIESAAKAPR